MKSGFILILFFLLSSGASLLGQDLMEQLRESAQQYNEATAGEEDPQPEADPTDTEKAEKWKKIWEANKEKYAGCMDQFDTKELNCFLLMSAYVESYLELAAYAANEEDPCRKYDLYGLQATSLALATTMLYCPEHIHEYFNDPNYGEERKRDFRNQIRLLETSQHQCVKDFFAMLKIQRDGIPFDSDYDQLDYFLELAEFFHPFSIVNNALAISQKMEALGCEDY